MKFSIKVLMAALLFCLPFAFISCGSDDDDDNGPKTFKYEWSMTYSMPSETSEKVAAVAAEETVNKAIGAAFASLGVVSNQTLTITGGDADTNDKKVKAQYYTVAATFETVAAGLPKDAKITIKRGGTKIINNEKLR